MKQETSKLLSTLTSRAPEQSPSEQAFRDFIQAHFGLTSLKKGSTQPLLKLKDTPDLDFIDVSKSLIFFTHAQAEAHLSKAHATEHQNFALSLIPTTSHKRSDLSAATRAINKAIPSYNILFFLSPESLSIAFATRRYAKNKALKTDIIEKITLIKDISLFSPHPAHLANLATIAAITPCAVDEYYQKILSALSIEKLNQSFFSKISSHFLEFCESLVLPTPANATEQDKREFVLRLISRVLFCKFLEKKGLIDPRLWDTSLSKEYYHEVLESLFFSTLNTPKDKRDYGFISPEISTLLDSVPYLNGGLFAPQNADCYDPANPHAHINTLKIPNLCFEQLFSTLGSFHFTLDESTSTEQEIGLDPELLGMVFENLLSVLFTDHKIDNLSSLRKATGSYYTPREIVSYMCKSSLFHSLASKCGDMNEEALHTLIFGEDLESTALSSQGEAPHSPKHHTDTATDSEAIGYCAILSALNSLQILDPACGSGAFPIGMLHEILTLQDKLYQKLDTLQEPTSLSAYNKAAQSVDSHKSPIEPKAKSTKKPTLYERKLHILEHQIYGIDIQPMATEISRLRCFLSLICDTPNQQINPLPNLEFKFITANSLLPLPTHTNLKYNGYEKDMQALNAMRQETFHTHDKASIEARYLTLRNSIAKKLIGAWSGDESALDNPLLHYNPYNPHEIAPFFDAQWMFGINSFDIIIGNPPYGATYPADHKQIFKTLYKSAQTIKNKQKGSLDTFSIFIEMAFNACLTNGSINLIVPMSITASESMTALHELLLQNCEQIWISSYGDRPQKVFRNAEQKVSIIACKKTLTPTRQLMTTKVNKRYASQSVGHVIKNLHFINSIEFVKLGRFPKISLEMETNILRKLFAHTQSVKDSIVPHGAPIYYRSSGNRYYNLITSHPTYSTKEKSFAVEARFQNLIGAILSSNLYFWFRSLYSNQRDTYLYEFEIMPIPSTALMQGILDKINCIYPTFMADIEKKANFTSTGTKEYRLRKSKHLIDEIDRFICPLYGLNEEEIDFIISYDVEFRTDEGDKNVAIKSQP